MAVMTGLQKTDSKGQETVTKKKYHHKSRPITATLDHPLILDIKLLKKLDMTTFTKKGLIALSKFCGISLINKRNTKKKLNKCIKTMQYSKKQLANERNGTETNTETNKNPRAAKRKLGKKNIKSKSRIQFNLGTEETSPDEDSLDVICKQHNGLKSQNSRTNDKHLDGKLLIGNILNNTIENVIPEPCKTCNRSEHPERFHSHPKMMMSLSLEEKTSEKNQNVAKNLDENRNDGGKKTPCANQEKQRSEEKKLFKNSNCSKVSLKSPTKSDSSVEVSSPESGNKIKSRYLRKPPMFPSTSEKTKNEILNKSDSKVGSQSNDTVAGEEDMKFVTGCYICGKQVSPKLRLKHEKSCILEWRAQNSANSPDKRKPEPKRPDYRFTASGDLDCEGTFESIWANHIDSLVPCKKCGRKFFPDRIERHENCCNNLPINIKYKH